MRNVLAPGHESSLFFPFRRRLRAEACVHESEMSRFTHRACGKTSRATLSVSCIHTVCCGHGISLTDFSAMQHGVAYAVGEDTCKIQAPGTIVLPCTLDLSPCDTIPSHTRRTTTQNPGPGRRLVVPTSQKRSRSDYSPPRITSQRSTERPPRSTLRRCVYIPNEE